MRTNDDPPQNTSILDFLMGVGFCLGIGYGIGYLIWTIWQM